MNRTRALLLAMAVPLLIVLGVLLAAAVGAAAASPSRRRPRPRRAGRPPQRGASRSSRPARSASTSDAGRAGPRSSGLRGATEDGPVVLFLHGWVAVDPAFYGPWIAHLVRAGATVIYPAYQEAPFLDPVSPLPNTLVAVRLALRAGAGRAGSAGRGRATRPGARSQRTTRRRRAAARLPVPGAVFSVYPGRSLRGIPLRIPAVSARNIAAGTRVVAYAGAADRLVGTRTARAIARTATRADVTLRIVRDPRVDDHRAPQRSSAASRRTFWEPLDRLIVAHG